MMKILLSALLLVTGVSIAQNENYSEQWRSVDSLEVRGLVESADSLTIGIIASARKNKDHLQVIKGKIYHYKLYQVNHEDSNQYILDDLNTTIAGMPVPYKNVLLSYKASMLDQYFKENRWKSRGRSDIDDPDSGSIETWSLNLLRDSIHAAYKKSLQQEKVLIATSAGEIEELLFSFPLNRKYRPTLYDVLAHRALDHYSNTSNFASIRAEDNFSFSSPHLYADTPEFIAISFPEAAHYTSGVKVLQTWQKLEALHDANNETVAKVFAQLNRLEYVNSQYTGKDKWGHYEDALANLSAQYEGQEVNSLILFNLAMSFYDRSTETGEDGKLLHPNFLKKAVDLAEKITKEFPNTNSSQKAYNLISTITKVELHAKVPAILAPGEPGRMFLSYKSLDSLEMKIYKVPENFSRSFNYMKRDSVILKFIERTELIKKFLELPKAEDYNTHSTEIVIPPMETGNYLIFASGPNEKNGFSYGFLQVTDLSLTKTEFDKYSLFRTLNRTTGDPLEDVKVEFHFTKTPTILTSTRNGEIIYKKNRDNFNSGRIMATKAADTLSTQYWPGYYYNAQEKEEDHPQARTMLYLDRAIYRPGQKVFFKGVLLQHVLGKTSTVPNTYVEVFVDDPNGEEIADFRLKTNKYGSFNGELKLPASGITGKFEIYVEEDYEEDSPFWDEVLENGDYEYSSLSFQVEEYKRPTFEVKFDELKESYKPGDTVILAGKAASLMGAGINNAGLTYEVTRQKLVRRWWSYTYSDPVPVVKDSATTDAEGNFSIEFPAISDEKDFEDEHLLYQYTINATLTDVSGETREASTSLKVGAKNLLTELSVPPSVNTGEDLNIKIENTNLNENPVPVTGIVRIYKLEGPGRILRNRIWEAPEIQLIPEQEFIKLFPEEPYESTLAPEEWPKAELVYEGDLINDGITEADIPVTPEWKSGKYLVETESNNGNNTATATKAFEVVNPQDQYLPDHQRFSYSVQNSDFEKDGKVELLLQTAYKDLKLEVTAYEGYRQIYKRVVDLNGRELLDISLKDLKGEELEIHINGIRNNAAITETRRIRIPQVEKLLRIETETFRNKIEPGVEETWSFTVRDEKNAIPDAEVLASMYDASLDQFITRNWSTVPGFGQTYTQFPNFSNTNIGSVYTLSNTFSYSRYYRSNARLFDRLEFFGFYFSQPNSFEYKRYLGSKKEVRKNSQSLTGNTRGIVTDADGIPLPGVNVMIKGTKTGTQTNFDGEFALDTQVGDELVFSYVGFISYEHKIGDKKEAYVVLEEDAAQLEEVVTTGYAVEVMEDSEEIPYPEGETSKLLQGRVAGVSISTSGNEEILSIRGMSSNAGENPLFIVDGKPVSSHNLRTEDILKVEVLKGEAATALYGAQGANGVVIITTKQGLDELQHVQARKDLDETAFFFPEINLDADGRLQFNFTSPEALTQWKLRLISHNRDWTTGKFEATVLTQKELSVTPNPPRFLREGDSITFKSKVSNLSAETLTGTAILQLYNAVTMEPIDSELGNSANTRNFNIAASNSTAVSWQLIIPKGIPAVTYRILAKAGDFSDGEENILPVLTNRIMVTESLPIFVRAGNTKTYEFENLKENTSTTLEHHQYSLEYSSNPAWYAIQSLPYLIEFEHECSEQTFARLYANSVAGHIINSQPGIREVFDAWKESGALVSDLEKNEELRSIIMAETPWVRDAASETEQKNRLAQLFDTAKLETEKEELVKRLKMMQNFSGAWPWFSGGKDNYYITRHIMGGLGHLRTLKISIDDTEIVKKAITYLDKEIVNAERHSKTFDSDPEQFYRSISNLHYLYVRSFYLAEHPIPEDVLVIKEKVLKAQKKDWHERNIYDNGLLSLVLMRMGEKEFAGNILAALKESSVKSEEYGMYWKENKSGWYWFRAPIETQALLIEAFSELGGEEKTVEELKIWLLQNKRTNHWPTTKATTEATYALLMQGEDWLQISDNTSIKVGGNPIAPENLAETKTEAGTGYMKLNWKADEIDDSFSKIEVENRNTTAGYGGVYWQYFEDLDKIKMHSESPLNVEKELYLNVSDQNGKSLKKISAETLLKVGDLVTVRLVVRSTADMDYIHLKDMRASGFEPTNVLSEYKYQDGTAYYESTRDAATHFFFDNLNKGTYVLEYTVRANNSGSFSNGITKIESMYAPEFSGHTKGIRVEIEDK